MKRRRFLLGSMALLLAACGGSPPAAKKPARACPYRRSGTRRPTGGASYGSGR